MYMYNVCGYGTGCLYHSDSLNEPGLHTGGGGRTRIPPPQKRFILSLILIETVINIINNSSVLVTQLHPPWMLGMM